MNNNNRLKVVVVSLFFISCAFFLISGLLAQMLPSQALVQSSEQQIREEKRKSFSETITYVQVEFSSLIGEIFVNPRYTGRITTIRTFLKDGSPRDNPIVDVRETKDRWEKVVVSESESDAVELIATGRKGSLKVSLSKEKAPSEVDKLQLLNQIIISFGQLSTTLITPGIEISNPAGFEIGILDFKEDKFLNGDIIAIKNNQVAVGFHNLSSIVVNKDGMIRLSLKTPDGSFVGADLKAWGYNMLVGEIEVGKPLPIKAEVFGLPEDAKLKFTFEPLPEQNITPNTKTLTVKDINKGTPIAKIVTSIPGVQPLRVIVEKVD
ncbi:MAG TPA: hypothetical protein VI935_00840 [Thermodesulfobacteriota bacterium]|nr:hypothetical protein [Thermodesulfobacteriota bacterium]